MCLYLYLQFWNSTARKRCVDYAIGKITNVNCQKLSFDEWTCYIYENSKLKYTDRSNAWKK